MRDAGPYLRTCHEHRTNSFEVSTAVSKQRFAPDSSRLTLSTGAARRERRYRKVIGGDCGDGKRERMTMTRTKYCHLSNDYRKYPIRSIYLASGSPGTRADAEDRSPVLRSLCARARHASRHPRCATHPRRTQGPTTHRCNHTARCRWCKHHGRSTHATYRSPIRHQRTPQHCKSGLTSHARTRSGQVRRSGRARYSCPRRAAHHMPLRHSPHCRRTTRLPGARRGPNTRGLRQSNQHQYNQERRYIRRPHNGRGLSRRAGSRHL